MSQKAILISDAHIKSRLWTNFPNIQGDSYEALKLVADASKDLPVISCGDFFDNNRPSSKDLEAAANLMRNASTFYYVKGNHDDCDPCIIDSLDGNHVHLRSDTPVALGKSFIFGIDYQNTKDKIINQLQEIAERVALSKNLQKGHTIVIMHQALKEFFNMSTFEAKEVFDILGPSVKVFIGDIHNYGLVSSDGGSGFIMSPGPLVPQDLNQARRPQNYYEIDTYDLSLNSVPLKVREYVFLDATVEGFDLRESLENLYKDLGIDRVRRPLPTAVIIKAYPGFKVPKELHNDDYIFVTDSVRPREEKRVATVELTLNEAVNAEIKNTEGNLAETMISISNHLLASDTPDELALAMLKKWKVIQNGI